MNTTPRSEQWCIPKFVVVPCEEAGGPILHSSNTHQSLGKKLAATYCNYSNIYLHTMSSQQKFWKWPLVCSLACRKKLASLQKYTEITVGPEHSACKINFPVPHSSKYWLVPYDDKCHQFKWCLRSDFLMHHELTKSVLYSQQRSSQYSQIIQAGTQCNCHTEVLWQPRWSKS